MLPNGQAAVIRMAVAALDDPAIARHQPALLLGAMRADVWYVPMMQRVVEHLSFSHFYRTNAPGGFLPFLTRGTRTMTRHYFAQALEEYRSGREAAAYVRLGEATHLIADMACPVHVHRVVHESDPYEWYVETHHEELRRLPLPSIETAHAPDDLVVSLANITRQHEPDRTRWSVGRVLRRVGLRTPVPQSVIEEQARTLIPLAAAHAAELFRLFRRVA